MTIASLAVIVNKENQILLQHRSDGAPTNPNKWQLFGGATEKGETPIQTIVRELKEELNISIPSDEMIFLNNYPAGYFEKAAVFLIKLKDISKLILGEGDGFGFFNKEAISSLDLENITSAALDDYFSG